MVNTCTIKTRDFANVIGVSTHLIYKIIKDNKLPIIESGNKKLLPHKTARTILSSRGFTYKKNKKPFVINIFGMKGGIGKTSIATALSEGASRLGFRVLAVDLDMQGNLTQSFDAKKQNQPVLYNVLREENTLKETIQKVHDGLDILPSSLVNSAIELFLSGRSINYSNYFNSVLKEVFDDYDLIVIDCPPSVTKSTTCAACFCDISLIPLNADMDSFDGVVMSVAEINRLGNDFDKNIPYKIVFNKYDAREKLSLSIMSNIAQHDELKDNLLSVVIRTDTGFKNTKAAKNFIYDLTRSVAKEDCYMLIKDLLGISKWQENKV